MNRACFVAIVLHTAACGAFSVSLGEGDAAPPRAATDASAPREDTADPDVPAACPDDPVCTIGACAVVPIGRATGTVRALAVGGDHVYWTYIGTGSPKLDDGAVGVVDRCRAGGATLATKQKAPYHIAADANGACWSNLAPGPSGGAGQIFCSRGVGAVMLADNEIYPWSIALDADRVYWTGGDPRTLVRSIGRSGGDAVDLYESNDRQPPTIAVDATTVYLGGYGKLLALPKEGGAATTLVDGMGKLLQVAADGARVYYEDPTNDEIRTMPSGGGPSSLVTRGASQRGSAFHVVGRDLYFGAGGSVWRVAKVGGDGEDLEIQADQYDAFATDGRYVFYAEEETIYRVRVQ